MDPALALSTLTLVSKNMEDKDTTGLYWFSILGIKEKKNLFYYFQKIKVIGFWKDCSFCTCTEV